MRRRHFLTALGLAGAWALTRPLRADPVSPAPRYRLLRQALADALADQEVALDLRWLTPYGAVVERMAFNADRLYPTASCFKAFLALYYFWRVPPDDWQRDEWSAVARTVIVSDNLLTGRVIADVAPYVEVYGSALEKFNDFLLLDMGLKHGLYTWKWPGNPVETLTDRRFTPSETRFSLVNGVAHRVDNLTTAADLADGYVFMLRPPENAPPGAVQAALDLLSIPAARYQSPFERAGLTGYTGKDGVLQQADISTGTVINDAGIVPIGDRRCILSFLSVGQSEFRALGTLKAVTEALRKFA